MNHKFFLGKPTITLINLMVLAFSVNTHAMGKNTPPTPKAIANFSALDSQGEKVLSEISAAQWFSEKVIVDHSESSGDYHIVYLQGFGGFSVSDQRLVINTEAGWSCSDCSIPSSASKHTEYDSRDRSPLILKLQQQNSSKIRIALGVDPKSGPPDENGNKIQIVHLHPGIFETEHYDRNRDVFINSRVRGQYVVIIFELDEAADELTISGYPTAESDTPVILKYQRVKLPAFRPGPRE